MPNVAMRFNDWYRGFAASRARCLAVAICYAGVLVVAASFAWDPNGVYDDWSISNALSARWGDSEGLCLFLNALLSNVVFGLNSLIPNVNWYFLLERATAFLSLLAIAYHALNKLTLPFAGVVVFGAVVLMLPGCTYESNFTYVAGMAVCAGGFVLLCSLARDAHSPGMVACGVLLMLVGALWRWTIFMLSVPIVGCAALLVLARRGSEQKHVSTVAGIVRLWPFALVLMLFAGAYLYDSAVWSESPWTEWREFNDVRSDISDYSFESYDDLAGKLSQAGVSENDYRMLKSWLSEDPEFFTIERLREVRDIVNEKRSDTGRILESFPRYVVDMATSVRFDALFAAVLIAVLFCSRGRGRAFALVVLVIAILLTGVLFGLGRLPARVSLPIWMFAAASACVLANPMHVRRGKHEQRRGGTPTSVLSMAFVALPVLAMAFVLAMSATHLKAERMQAVFDEGSFTPDNYLVDYLEAHDDEVYALNVASSAVLIYANCMIAPLDEHTIEHTTSLGGWAARAPYAVARNARVGMDNPMKGLVENPRARLISPSESSAKTLVTYLREHYYPKASYKCVDTIDGGPDKKAYVYQFTA